MLIFHGNSWTDSVAILAMIKHLYKFIQHLYKFRV